MYYWGDVLLIIDVFTDWLMYYWWLMYWWCVGCCKQYIWWLYLATWNQIASSMPPTLSLLLITINLEIPLPSTMFCLYYILYTIHRYTRDSDKLQLVWSSPVPARKDGEDEEDPKHVVAPQAPVTMSFEINRTGLK